jgi:leucyl-tRNA synthetase
MTEIVESEGYGKASVQYRLRDWVFSRQRYWGEPIPLVHCDACGWVPLPDSELPLVLPDVERYEPSGTGESPLSLMADWVETACPACGAPARRETDTMPQWAGSSWYFLRYADPHNDSELASREALEYWTPVDWYNGGMEHTTLHLLYSRFWHKFLFDIGVVPTSEPYAKRTSHGLILGEGGEKMSKSRGNVVNPDEMVDRFGADAFRLYELFMGAFDQPIPWLTNGLVGMGRFISRVWEMQAKVGEDAPADVDTTRAVHQTIKHVGERIEAMKFNTAVAALMELSNRFGQIDAITKADWEAFVLLLAPFAPHVAEEMWEAQGHDGMLARHPWPEFDSEKAAEDEIEVPVQVNGKLRAKVTLPADSSGDAIKAAALAEIASYTEGKTVRKVLVVGKPPRRLVNVVVK